MQSFGFNFAKRLEQLLPVVERLDKRVQYTESNWQGKIDEISKVYLSESQSSIYGNDRRCA